MHKTHARTKTDHPQRESLYSGYDNHGHWKVATKEEWEDEIRHSGESNEGQWEQESPGHQNEEQEEQGSENFNEDEER